MVSPFRIRLWDKTLKSTGQIGAPLSVTVFPRHNQQPTAQIVLDGNDPIVDKCVVDGTRVTIDYAGAQLLSGRVDRFDGTGPAAPNLTLQLRDNWEVLPNLLGWADPDSPITDQSGAYADAAPAGLSAESVVKGFVSRNLARLGDELGGIPVVVAPSLGRGPVKRWASRFDSLADELPRLLDLSGLGLTVRQNGTTELVVDCYASRVYSQTLTYASGAVLAVKYSRSGPTITRVVAGGQGEKTQRMFRASVDAPLEAQWGTVIERFVEVRDAETSAELQAAADEALLEGRPLNGLSIQLAETPSFRYGRVRVGDVVPTELLPGVPPVTDVVREAVLNWSADNGFTALPQVGDRTDDPSRQLQSVLTSMARSIRRMKTGR